MNSINKFSLATFFVTFVAFLSQSMDVFAMHSQESSERPSKKARTNEVPSNPSLLNQNQEPQRSEATDFGASTYFTNIYSTDSSSSSSLLPEFIPPDHHSLGGSGSKPKGPGDFFGEASEGQAYSSSSSSLSSSSSFLPDGSLPLDSFNIHNTQENPFTQQLPFDQLTQYFNQIDQSGFYLSDSQDFNLPNPDSSEPLTLSNLQAPFKQLPPISSAKSNLQSSSISSSSSSNNSLPAALKGSQKNHICTECKQPFRSPSELGIHMRIHAGERPYKCPQCNKSFGKNETLTRHIKTHTDEKSHKCTKPECNYTAHQKEDLKKHMRIHTGERPYQCTECDKAFSRSDVLIRHMNTHTDKKPHKCTKPKCNYASNDKSNLTRHIKTHIAKNKTFK